MIRARKREREANKNAKRQNGHVGKKVRTDSQTNSISSEDLEFLPVDTTANEQDNSDGISPEVRALMRQQVVDTCISS